MEYNVLTWSESLSEAVELEKEEEASSMSEGVWWEGLRFDVRERERERDGS